MLRIRNLAALAGCGGPDMEPETGITAVDDLQGLLDRVTRTVGGARNAATAAEALPVLDGVSEELDMIIDRLPNLSPTARADLSQQAARALPGLKDNARRVANSDGIDVLGPSLNKIVDQVSRLL